MKEKLYSQVEVAKMLCVEASQMTRAVKGTRVLGELVGKGRKQQYTKEDVEKFRRVLILAKLRFLYSRMPDILKDWEMYVPEIKERIVKHYGNLDILFGELAPKKCPQFDQYSQKEKELGIEWVCDMFSFISKCGYCVKKKK